MIHLSPRHRQIVELVANGWSYPKIAKKLGIHHETVRTHVRVIVKRLRSDQPPRVAMCEHYLRQQRTQG